MSTIKTHLNLNPTHLAETDFVIVARIDLGGDEPAWEQLCARRVSDDLFRVTCIPFFVDGVSYGDVVRTRPEGKVGYAYVSVVEVSGHGTLRAFLSGVPRDDSGYARRRHLAETVIRLGGMIEFMSTAYASIDAPTDQVYAELRGELRRREEAGELEWADGDIT